MRCEELAEDARAGFTLLQVVDAGRADGREMVIHEQAVHRKQASRPRMQTVKDASYCEQLVDYYALHARLVVGRLLRPFLDDERVTALELLHDYTRLRRLMRDDRLYPLALNHIASLQARLADRPAAERRAEIDRAVQQIIERARGGHAYAGLSRALAEGGLPAAATALPAGATPDQARLHLSAAIARYLRDHGDWTEKLQALLDLTAGANGSEAGCALIDEAVAEILQSADAVEALLGHAPSLADRLVVRIRLARGELHTACDRPPVARTGAGTGADAPQLAQRLSRAFAHGEAIWQQAPATLMRQVESVLHGTRPLANQATQEAEAFERVVAALHGVGGLAGGPETADAVTRRARLVYGDAFENLPPRPTVEKVAALLSPRSAQIGYLLALAASPFGRKYAQVMVAVLTETLKGLTSREALLADGGDPREIQQMVRELTDRLSLLDPQRG
ncbi:MAG: hypothetical protein U5L06_10155 [Rhodovibrio sp.]|nr:hypothetical protein [Rhodovibrio sp.]